MTLARIRHAALDLVPVALGAAATALLAQVSVHLWPVPVTLQTFAVLSCGLLLGARRGAAAQGAYLLAGAAGMPVFAEMKAGPQWLFGPTGGYLWAFALVAALAGWAAERWRGPRLGFAILGANALLLGIGTAWLSVVLGRPALTEGLWPFLPGALAQSAAAWAASGLRRGSWNE